MTDERILADQCKRLEDAGISVYVASGATDINNQTPYRFTSEGMKKVKRVFTDEFIDIFGDYGYNEAVFTDTETLSYACDIPGTNLRILNLSIPYYWVRSGSHKTQYAEIASLDDPILDWTENVLSESQKEGKEVLVMSYFPVTDALGKNLGNVVNSYTIKLENSEIAQYMFAEYGVKYVLSAHTHFFSEELYEDENGSFVNVCCTSLTNYPLDCLLVHYRDGVWSSEHNSLQTIPTDYLPSYLSDEEKSAIGSDLLTFAIDYMNKSIHHKMEQYIHENGTYSLIYELMEIFCLYNYEGVDEEKADIFADTVYHLYLKFMDLPLYGTDIDSMESLLAPYGITIPKSDYKTFSDMLVKILAQVYTGTSHLKKGSSDLDLLRNSAYCLCVLGVQEQLYDKIQAIQPYVEFIDLEKHVNLLIADEIWDLRTDDLLLRMMSIFSPMIYKYTKLHISFTSTDSLLSALDLALPVFFAVFFGDNYDAEAKTVYDVPILEYIDLEKGIVYVRKIIDDVFFELWLQELLY